MPIIVPDTTVRTAADLFALPPTALRPLDRGGAPDGAVFHVRRSGEEAFLKVKPIGADAVPAERDRVDLVRHLSAYVRVPEYLLSTAGEPLEVVTAGADHYAVTLTARAPGRHVEIPRDWTPQFIRSWATTLGTIHAALRDYRGGTSLPGWRDEHGHFLDSCRDDEVGRVWVDLGEAMAALPTGIDEYGIVHNDLHTGNLLIDEGGALTVLDFDVASRHWFLTDLAILLVHPLWELHTKAPADMQPFVDTAVEAYTGAFPTETTTLTNLPLLMRYRMALFVLAMANELGDGARPPWLEEIRSWVLSGEPLPGFAGVTA